MSNLLERYSTIKQIHSNNGSNSNGADHYDLVQPYLKWQLGEADAQSNILLFKPRTTGQLGTGDRMVILVGDVAKAWFEYRETLKPG